MRLSNLGAFSDLARQLFGLAFVEPFKVDASGSELFLNLAAFFIHKNRRVRLIDCYAFKALVSVVPASWYNLAAFIQDSERLVEGQTAEADFANASAVAATYQLVARGTFLNGANAGTFAFQFAQNTSDVLSITLLAGATFKVWQF